MRYTVLHATSKSNHPLLCAPMLASQRLASIQTHRAVGGRRSSVCCSVICAHFLSGYTPQLAPSTIGMRSCATAQHAVAAPFASRSMARGFSDVSVWLMCADQLGAQLCKLVVESESTTWNLAACTRYRYPSQPQKIRELLDSI